MIQLFIRPEYALSCFGNDSKIVLQRRVSLHLEENQNDAKEWSSICED